MEEPPVVHDKLPLQLELLALPAAAIGGGGRIGGGRLGAGRHRGNRFDRALGCDFR